MPQVKSLALLFLLSPCAVLCSAAPQQNLSVEPTRSAIVSVTTSEIRIDGLLEEPDWFNAPKIGELVQREPKTGDNPTERTDITLLHDADNLYIGVMCYDSEPQKILGTQMERDADINRSDDRITIVLDTFRDQQNAFYFSTNPAGALVDGLVFANGQSNNDWDAIWTVRTRRTNQGWSAEFEIPSRASIFLPAGASGVSI